MKNQRQFIFLEKFCFIKRRLFWCKKWSRDILTKNISSILQLHSHRHNAPRLLLLYQYLQEEFEDDLHSEFQHFRLHSKNKPYCFTMLNQLHLFRIPDAREKFQPERYSQAIKLCKSHSRVDSLLNATIITYLSQEPIVFCLSYLHISLLISPLRHN